jgi:hypothetical protein
VRERHITWPSAGSALLVTSGNSTVRTLDGREFTAGFAHSLLLVQRDGGWRVLHSHQSSPPP